MFVSSTTIESDHGSGWVPKLRTRYTAIEKSNADEILIPNLLLNKGEEIDLTSSGLDKAAFAEVLMRQLEVTQAISRVR